jgi:hypothetical protein
MKIRHFTRILVTPLLVLAGVGILSAVAPATAAFASPKATVPCSSGAAGLVAAINTANGSGGGAISLASGCTYTLTTPDNGENGLPVITTSVAVNGNGATISGSGAVRILEVDGPGGNLSLQNVTLSGGSAVDFGGAIANLGGTVVLNHSQVANNAAVAGGGGIASATFDPSSVAKLTLNDSSVTNNNQTLPAMDNGVGGGGILNILGTATLNGSAVNDNTAQGFVGGGIANGDYMNFTGTTSVLTLNGSQVNGNTAPNAGGGGIQNLLGSVTLNRSQADGNSSLNGGGISSGNGNGGIPPGVGQLVLNKSEVDGNTATAPVPQGPGSGPPIAAGGVANGGNAVLNNSKIDNNTASHTSGAGIVNHGSMILNKSEVNGNTAAGSGPFASGGGIINAQGPPGASNTAILTINNSQVNNNRAGGDGGGIANGVPLGGPMPLIGGPVTLNHSQVNGNTAAHGGGIFNSGGTITLASTSVTSNSPDNCEPLSSIAGCIG